MKKINIVLASSTAALLLASAPLLASAHEGSMGANASANAQVHSDNGLHLGLIASLFGRSHNDGNKDNDTDNDKDDNKPEHATSTQPHVRPEAGTVTSVNGSVFTLVGFGRDRATTTVSTNGSTVYTVNGQATTSSALKVGDHVLITGTSTTASSTTNFTASIVNIFTRGWGFLKHHFFH